MTGPNPWPSVAVISLMGVPCSLDPPASASLLLGLQLCHHSRLCWELNSGQCACQAMTLPIELPPSFKRIFKRKLIVIPCTDSLLKKKITLILCAFLCAPGVQGTSFRNWFCLSTMWNSGIEPQASGLAASSLSF